MLGCASPTGLPVGEPTTRPRRRRRGRAAGRLDPTRSPAAARSLTLDGRLIGDAVARALVG